MNRALMIGGALVGAAGATVAPSMLLVLVGAFVAVSGFDRWQRARDLERRRRPGYIVGGPAGRDRS